MKRWKLKIHTVGEMGSFQIYIEDKAYRKFRRDYLQSERVVIVDDEGDAWGVSGNHIRWLAQEVE